ncbi:LysR substrate-binding domain-containing protein [Aestuariirhabdus sp. Z084]|uniref:LysR substrate-binding domain-containing protein n=1 Tax=Aestuariirhabdus haliotis TaxID=2918751 RepID=UPI00201B44F3|nr:LysR substrate-binding domain-containing protein [Aestuariirhabdus haliotis]MCL6416982.1 LysR substrate-binding domain-containing protein [Aestuariirhabdus haliotis]MCL6421011.1 LysR substrate-binding domain-containing protein [Aestuariirhabdus haliotis]
MANPITIEALQVIDAINRRGSFSAAADELFKVPSAISYTVQKLEQDLDVTIFDRSGHRAVLTPAGEMLLERGRQILEATAELADATRQAANGWESRLSIAVDGIIPIKTLLPMIARFNEHQKGVEIQLHHEVLMGCWDALTSHRADLVIGAGKATRPGKHFNTLPLGEHEFVFAVAPGHPLTEAKQPLEPDSIAAFTSVAVRDSSRHLPARTHGILDRQLRLTLPDIPNKVRAQKAGLGVGYLPRSAIRRELAEGTLIELKTLDPQRPNKVETLVAWRSGSEGRALKWFVSELRKDNEIRRYLNNTLPD